MTAKDTYLAALMVQEVLRNNLREHENRVRKYKTLYQKECSHPSTVKKGWEDLHKGEWGASIYCAECDKYLKEEE